MKKIVLAAFIALGSISALSVFAQDENPCPAGNPNCEQPCAPAPCDSVPCNPAPCTPGC